MPDVGTAPLTLMSLPSDLLDGISEAVAWSPDHVARAAAIVAMVEEIVETVLWLHGSNEAHEEIASLCQLVDAVHAHRQRMSTTETT
jgi:hypothetical protein